MEVANREQNRRVVSLHGSIQRHAVYTQRRPAAERRLGTRRNSSGGSPREQRAEGHCAPLGNEQLPIGCCGCLLVLLNFPASPASPRFRRIWALPVKVGLFLKDPSRVTPSCMGVWWYALGPTRGIADR
jgi:hypothetical protein